MKKYKIFANKGAFAKNITNDAILCAKDHLVTHFDSDNIHHPFDKYITQEMEAVEGLFYIQEDGGGGEPILRKIVSEVEYHQLGGVKHGDRLGYFPTTLGVTNRICDVVVETSNKNIVGGIILEME